MQVSFNVLDREYKNHPNKDKIDRYLISVRNAIEIKKCDTVPQAERICKSQLDKQISSGRIRYYTNSLSKTTGVIVAKISIALDLTKFE